MNEELDLNKIKEELKEELDRLNKTLSDDFKKGYILGFRLGYFDARLNGR